MLPVSSTCLKYGETMHDHIQRYINSGSTEQQALIGRLEGLILELFPDARQTIYYGLPTYKSGKGQVSVGFWKEGVTLYTTNPEHIAAFKAANPKIRTNKASINFKIADPLPIEEVEGVVRRAMGGT